MKLTHEQWQSRREAHRQRVLPWVEAHRQRAAHGEKHPVYDFLFTYYSLRPAHLLRWSPGVGVLLENASDLDWPLDFKLIGEDAVLNASAFPEHRRKYLHWAIDYLQSVTKREPSFACFGLHEWAMVYRTDDVRHSHVPLRLSPEEIAELVESQGLRCTHFDAYRFFTPAAVPRNRISLTRAVAGEHDQSGCIHATMDLYKFAYTIAPFIPAELITDTFELARTAREIDMRASLYDLAAMGFPAIAIETKAGREEYVQHQRKLIELATPLRQQVLEVYQRLVTDS